MTPSLLRALVGLIAITFLAGISLPARAQGPGAPGARYRLAATIAEGADRITAKATVEWRNATGHPVEDVRISMPWSVAVPDEGSPVDAFDRASPAGPIDMLPSLIRVSPTVWSVRLSPALAPGHAVEFEVQWSVPVGRWNVRQPFVLLQGWYPKIEGVSGPTPHEVDITAPAAWIVGASGTPIRGPGSTTKAGAHRFAADLARDVAWTAAPLLVDSRDRFAADGLPPVDIRLLLQPDHQGHRDRFLSGAKAVLEWFGRSIGPFPLESVTLVSTPMPSTGTDSGHAGGGLVPVPTRWFTSWIEGDIEWAIARGLADAYAARVAASAAEREAIGHMLALRVMDGVFRNRFVRVDRYFRGAIAWPHPDLVWQPPSRDRTTRTWVTLERLVGPDIVSATLSRWLGPGADLIHGPTLTPAAIASNASGRDMSWFFAAMASDGGFDYAVGPVDTGTTPSITVRRLAPGVFPIEVRTIFDDGSSRIDRWDGRDASHTWAFPTGRRMTRVDVDPDHVLQLDDNRGNNTWTATALPTRTWPWALRWAAWLQQVMISHAFVV